jgi:hypothetical protein
MLPFFTHSGMLSMPVRISRDEQIFLHVALMSLPRIERKYTEHNLGSHTNQHLKCDLYFCVCSTTYYNKKIADNIFLYMWTESS